MGAPKKNKNAAKQPEQRRRKHYINLFGQRWSTEQGQAIQAYLHKQGLTQKEWLNFQFAELLNTANLKK